MSFEINNVLKDMTNAISETVEGGIDDIKHSIEQILNAEKESLEELAEAFLQNQIDETVFNREIEREKKVVEVELLTIQIMTKAYAQKAVNAAIDIFVNAVKAAL